jgi:hypothetical protein
MKLLSNCRPSQTTLCSNGTHGILDQLHAAQQQQSNGNNIKRQHKQAVVGAMALANITSF